ncbi:hypothetical protein EOL70_04745 [Leucothrix sargassi]|nr:hypothetical protein EOL70_04745 [Leucothrix sargassi]
MKKTAILASLAVTALGVTSNVHAKTINVEAGPLFSKVFADIRCKRAAQKANGKWTGRYWLKPGSLDGYCQIVVPDPVVKIIPPKPPKKHGQPKSTFISVNADQLWNQNHANWRCPQLAKAKGGTWTGKWSNKTATAPSYCQIEIKPKKVIQPPKPTYKTIKVKAGRIWSQEHANQRCVELAKANRGTWTKRWSSVGERSTCDVRVEVKPAIKPAPVKVVTPPAPSKSRHERNSVREVSAGGIWDQAHAARKCPLIAQQTNGTWTGKWRKTGAANNAAVCEVKYQPLHQVRAAQAAPQPAPTPVPVQTRNTREVDSGYIWDANQANTKCPLYAAQNNGRWTGKWRKISTNNRAVCEVEFGAVAQAVVTASPTTYVPLAPQPVQSSNTREVAAGPIWDDNQAKTKCPHIASNNQGTWTGKWRKTGPNHASLCEVRF